MNLDFVKTNLVRFIVLILGLLIMSALTACGGPPPTGTPTPVGTPMATPTGAPYPMITPTPIQPPPGQYQPQDFGIVWSSSFYQKEYNRNPPQQWAANAGATWDRWDIGWEWSMTPREGLTPPVWTDTTSTNYFPSPKENYYYSYDTAANGDKATSPQLKTLGVLNGGFPKGDVLGENPYFPNGSWQQFVATTVDDFSNRIDAWEIGNETGFVVAVQELGHANYLEALARACEQIEDKPIILGSPQRDQSNDVALNGANVTTLESQMYYNILNGLRTDYIDLADQCLTAAGIHSYLTIDEASTAITGLRNQSLWSKPFWVTEAGAGAQGPGRSNDSNEVGFHINSDQQADYIPQFFALTKQAFNESGTGEIMYHRLRDDADPVSHESTYGLISSNNEPWPAYYAAWMTSQLLGEATFDSEQACTDCRHLVFKGRNDDFIHVLWATQENDLPSVPIEAKDPLTTHMLAYRRNAAQQYYTKQAKPESQKIVSGAVAVPLGKAQSITDPNTNTPIRPIGGETVILIEYRGDGTKPTGLAGLICTNERSTKPDAALIMGYDSGSGIDQLVINTGIGTTSASAAHSILAASSVVPPGEYTLDLSELEPNVLYITTTTLIPDVGQTWVYTLTDKAGNATVGSITNKATFYCPGGDNPDDNFSAASAASLPTGGNAVSLEQHPPRVAVLNNGFTISLLRLLLSQNEPAVFVEADFDPAATYAQYPVLIIPTGGLYGLSDSAVFRARLEEYTRLGGTLIVFDQQHGSDYAALPGGRVGGYGWDEDISCFVDAFYLAQYHPALAGFDHPRLSIHADGFFRTYPVSSTILLRRSANGMPGAIVYPFGAGRVFATTIYDDWGIDNSQIGTDAPILLRDLITWSTTPVTAETGTAETIPSFKVDETVAVTFSLTNTTSFTTTHVRLDLITPARELTATQTITLEIGPDQAVEVPFTTTAALPLGLWRTTATLLDGQAEVGIPKSEIVFAVINPPGSIAPDNDLTLSVGAPTNTFVKWSDATFTFTVTNHADVEQTATVHYWLPGHFWSGVSGIDYGRLQPLSYSVVVPANDVAEFTWTVPLVVAQDTVWAEIVENGARAWFNISVVLPQASVQVGPIDPPPYYSGQPANLVVTVTNSAPLTITPAIVVIANKYTSPRSGWVENIFRQQFTATVPAATFLAGEVQPGQVTVTLPFTPVVAPFSVWSGGSNDVRRVYLVASLVDTAVNHQTYFDLAGSLGILAQPLAPWIPDQSGSLVVTATNILMSSSASGIMTATLLDSQGLPLSASNQSFALPAGSQAAWTLALPLPTALSVGNYQLQLVATSTVEVMTRTLTLPFTPSMEPAQWDHTAYRAGETAVLTTRLRNTSLFQPQVTITTTASDLSYESVQVVTLPANGEITATFNLPLSPDLASGGHAVELNYAVSGGDTWSQAAYLSILPPDLQAELEQANVQVGEPLTLTVHNTGGARANVAYNLYLYDAHERLMASTAGQLGVLSLNATGTITWMLADNLAAGSYLLRGEVRDQWTGHARTVLAPLTVQGLQVDLRVGTDQDIYTVGQPITVTVGLTNTGPMLTNAQLDLRALPPAAQLQWDLDRSGLAGVYVNDLKFDAQGNLWAAIFGQGLNVLNDHGTPFDNTDDEWGVFSGLTTTTMSKVLLAGDLIWVGSYAGVHVLDTQGAPFEAVTQTWQLLDMTGDPTQTSVDALVTDTHQILWLATNLGVQARDTNGTPLDTTNDLTHTFVITHPNGRQCWGLDPTTTRARCFPVDIAIDQNDVKWLATYGGGVTVLDDKATPFDPVGDQQVTFFISPTVWTTRPTWTRSYTLETATPPVWISSTNSLNNAVWAVALEPQGPKWFATQDGLYAFDDNGTPFDLTDDRWQAFTQSDGLLSNITRAVWIDPQGRKWITSNGGVNILDDNHTPFDKSDDFWEAYHQAHGFAAASATALAADPVTGHVWIGGNAGGVSLHVAGRLRNDVTGNAWHTSWPITLTVGQTITLALPTDLLSEPGKFQVTARLLSGSQQEVATTQQDFYLFAPSSSAMARLRGLAALRLQTPTAANAVTLDVIPGVVYPEQPFTLQGTLRNLGATTQQRVLHLSQDGSETYTLGPVTLEPGGVYTYTTTATAPITTGLSLITARSTATDDSDPIVVEEVVRVARPALIAELQAPDVVGYDPFTVTVLLKNASFITGSVQMTLGEHSETVSVGPGTIQTVPFMTQVDRNTTLIIQISGDLSTTLGYEARVGGFVGVDALPQEVYPAGRVEVPYNLINYEGSTARFTAFITLTSNTDFSQTLAFEATVAPYATVPGTLVFEDLPVGEYTVSAMTLYVDEPQVTSFRVAPAEAVDLLLTTGPTAGSWLTLTVMLTNTGAQPFDGSLALEGDLGSPVVTATLSPGSAGLYPFVFDLSGVARGTHPVTVTAFNASGQPLSVQSLALNVQGPQLTLSAPANIELTAGQMVSVTVSVENRGDQARTADVAFNFSEFASEQQQVWLEPGQTQTITYEFYLPDDLASGVYLTHYTLSGGAQPIEGILPITVVGIDVSVEAATDAPYYQSGDIAHMALTVTNNNEATTPDLFALTRFNGNVLTQPVTFAGSTAPVTFDIPVDFTTNDKVFYGLYQQATGRGVHLNTIYLYEFNSDLTLVTDRQVYRPGDTVQVTLVTTATGNLFVVAPGYQNDLTLPATGFQFDLPTGMTRGTYEIQYQLTGCNCALDSQTKVYRFDVAAPQVKITRAVANLEQASAVDLNLQIKASEPLTAVLRTWILAPNGQHGTDIEQSVTLLAIPHNTLTLTVPIEDTQLGAHQVAYELTHPADADLVYAAGATRFERGSLSFVNLRLLQSEYLHTTDVVELEALIYASHPITGQGELSLDGVLVREGAMAITAGTHAITFTVPEPLTPGWHDLSVRLSADGLSETRSLRLAYGSQAADLVVSAPQLTIASTGITGTLEVFVRNAGSEDAAPTWLKLWDGAPEAEGSRSLGVAEVPALTAGEGRWFSFIWGLPLEGGLNSLYAVADIYDEVTEFYEDNNLSRHDVQVPGFAVQVATDQTIYDPNQTAMLYLTTFDLWPDRAATLNVTTTVTSGSSTTVFEDARQIVVPIGESVTTMVPWFLGGIAPGAYTVRVVAREGEEQHTAWVTRPVQYFTDFTAQPLTGTAPLTVTFTDLSAPPYAIQAWNWDFGDSTPASTEQSPSHIYANSGTYTVTLQITADGQMHQRTRPAYITVSEPVTTPIPLAYSLWDDTVTPAIAAVEDADSVEVGVRFHTQVDGYITGLRFYKGITNTGTHLGHLWTISGTLLASATFTDETASGWQTVMFPYPVAVVSDTVYVASYHAPTGHFAVTRNYFVNPYVQPPLHAFASSEITGGNGVYVYPGGFPDQSFLDSNYWVDVVFDTTPPVIDSTPYSLWAETDTPAVAAVGDGDSVELGVRFQTQVDGYITGLRFYKGEANTGTHVGHLWTISGTLLASVTFTNETTSGWQTITFSQPVAVVSTTVYVASYQAPNGHFALNTLYFASPYVRPPLRTFSITEITGGNGVYVYPSGFPDQSSLGSNYWVDVVFQIILP